MSNNRPKSSLTDTRASEDYENKHSEGRQNSTDLVVGLPSTDTPSQFISPLVPVPKDNASIITELEKEGIDYLKPDYASFNEIAAFQANDSKKKDFIQAAATTSKNFIDWAASQKLDWIRKPNADKLEDLVTAINHGTDAYEKSAGRSVAVGFSVVASAITAGYTAYNSTTNITPGQIVFSNDRGNIMVHTTVGLNYLVSPRHTWGSKHMLSENHIKEGIVQIIRILPGEIGLATEEGNPIVLLPGRHAYNSAQFIYNAADNKNISVHDLISHSTISIVRVQTVELGLASENGNPILLLPGLHAHNTASFKYLKKINMVTLSVPATDPVATNSRTAQRVANHFVDGTITIARVDNNQLGKALDGRESHLLLPGLYIKNTSSFRFEGVVDAVVSYVNYNNIHRIQVSSDKFARVWYKNGAILLPPRSKAYEVNSSLFTFVDFVPANDKVITHGSITRVIVNGGELGYAWYHGVAVELAPKIHVYDDPLFKFEKCLLSNQEVISFGNITHIIVQPGQARVINKDGVIEILYAGRQSFTSPTLIISPQPIFLQHIVKPLKEIKVNTRDRTPMHVTGQVTYRVTDPEKFIKNIAQDKFDAAIEASTDAIIRQEIAQTDLSMISPASQHKVAHPNEEEKENRTPLLGGDVDNEGSNFRGKLCHSVLENLKRITSQWGIEIADFAISDISFQDKEVEKSLANATADTRKQEALYELQRAQNLTAISLAEATARKNTINEQNKSTVVSISAEAAATKTRIEATAEAEAKAIAIERGAKADVAAAQAKADAALKQAESKRDADIALAVGITAINKAQMQLYDNAGYIQVRMAELQVQAAQALARQNVPAMVFNGNGSDNSSANGMFFAQGMTMFNAAKTLQATQQQQARIEHKQDDLSDATTPQLK
jgi:regulator of protease activity HflC (stomatin/prohibitin superfamily)